MGFRLASTTRENAEGSTGFLLDHCMENGHRIKGHH